jgi:hypothetical protein
MRGTVVKTRDRDYYFTLISVFVVSLGGLKEVSLLPTFVRNILSILGLFYFTGPADIKHSNYFHFN